MDPITLALLGLAGLVLVGGGGGGGSKSFANYNFGTKKKPNRDEARRFILNETKRIEQKYNTMPGLHKYLAAIAWKESRYNPFVQNGNERNSARGLMQLRADSAFRKTNGLEHLRSKPKLLLDPRWNLAMSIDYAARGIERAVQEGGRPDWYAVRRWWGIPSLVHDYAETNERSQKVRRELPEFYRAAGLDPIDASREAVLRNYPGVKVIASELGLKI